MKITEIPLNAIRQTELDKDICNFVSHRVGKPASFHFDGENVWYEHNELHREDGPALITNNLTKYFYIRGAFIKSESNSH